MPWKDETPMDQKIEFVREHDRYVLSGVMSMTELCEEHGISRKTGYKMIQRRNEGGWPGLADRSRSPRGGTHWTDPDQVVQVLELRLRFPHWGAGTIRAYLCRHEPELVWPSRITIHGWIKNAGLIEPTPRTRRFPHPGKPLFPPPAAPNEQWSADFKGHFRTRDGRYCYGLTVSDSFSRYLIACDALTSTSYEATRKVFERVFREYGLPEHILSDNGTPFSSNSLRRLSKLSVWWIRLGIGPRLIEPHKPQQNGSHERMHGHMKPLVCENPSRNARAQQKQFNWFIDHFNTVRPHQGLNDDVPADRYRPSPRQFPRRLPQIEYPGHFEVRRVRSSGEIKWQGQWLHVSEVLAGESIGFELVADDTWIVHFGSLVLGYYSALDRKLHLDRARPKAESA